MKYKRVLVIGDIHGHFSKFMSLYNKLKVTAEDLLIFLGDYIDRGNENRKMLEWIMRESEKENVIALRGNHEQMLLECFRNQDLMWIYNGGKETFNELRKWSDENEGIIKDVFKFINRLPLCHMLKIKGQEYFFCHAGVDPKKTLKEQTEEELLWIREKFFTEYNGDTIIVVGHTPLMLLRDEIEIAEFFSEFSSVKSIWRSDEEVYRIKNTKPQWRRNGKVLMLDTGSYMPNGYISCVNLLNGDIWQSD